MMFSLGLLPLTCMSSQRYPNHMFQQRWKHAPFRDDHDEKDAGVVTNDSLELFTVSKKKVWIVNCKCFLYSFLLFAEAITKLIILESFFYDNCSPLHCRDIFVRLSPSADKFSLIKWKIFSEF